MVRQAMRQQRWQQRVAATVAATVPTTANATEPAATTATVTAAVPVPAPLTRCLQLPCCCAWLPYLEAPAVGACDTASPVAVLQAAAVTVTVAVHAGCGDAQRGQGAGTQLRAAWVVMRMDLDGLKWLLLLLLLPEISHDGKCQLGSSVSVRPGNQATAMPSERRWCPCTAAAPALQTAAAAPETAAAAAVFACRCAADCAKHWLSCASPPGICKP